MSAQTTPNKLVDQITGNLMKKNANLLGCQPGKWLLVFIDDLNIPQMDSFGDQATLETFRYILQTGERNLDHSNRLFSNRFCYRCNEESNPTDI